jgi:acyl-CoA thioester hydrolase
VGDSASSAGTCTVRVGVRSYEVDANGHLNHAYYHRYGEHARAEHFRAAGCGFDAMLARGIGVVLLETHVRFLAELRLGDEVEVDSRLTFGTGKSFEMAHTLRRVAPEPAVAAEITCRMGVLDQAARRLVARPRERLAELATDPALLGAAPA